MGLSTGAIRLDHDEREKRLRPLVDLWGSSVSCLAVHGDFEFFQSSGNSGLLPFKTTGKLALALGEPLAPPSAVRTVVEEFLWFAKRRGLVPGFYPVSREFFDRHQELGFGAIASGSENLVALDDCNFGDAGFAAVRQAIGTFESAGLSVRWVRGGDLSSTELRRMTDLEAASAAAAGVKGGMAFLASQLMASSAHKEFSIVADSDGIQAYAAWQTMPDSSCMLDGLAGTEPDSEMSDWLVYSGLQHLKAARRHRVCLGLVPLACVDEGAGPAANGIFPGWSGVYQWLFDHSVSLGHLRKRHLALQRFRPELRNVYFLFHPARPSAELLSGFLDALFFGFGPLGLVSEAWSLAVRGLWGKYM